MLKLHGHPYSHNSRKVHWALVESGIPHEFVTVDLMQGEQKADAFMKLNPNGRVPVIQDGDLTMYESNAILWYLAEKSGKLLPTDAAGRAECIQWLLWQASDVATTFLEPWMMKFMAQMGQPLDEAAHAAAVSKAAQPLAVLDAHLSDRKHVAGGTFTIVDIALAESIGLAADAGISLAESNNVRRWFEVVTAREAFGKTRPAG